MKVFILAWFYDREGYSEPLAVYSTREKAEAVQAALQSNESLWAPDIFEIELDAEPATQ